MKSIRHFFTNLDNYKPVLSKQKRKYNPFDSTSWQLKRIADSLESIEKTFVDNQTKEQLSYRPQVDPQRLKDTLAKLKKDMFED